MATANAGKQQEGLWFLNFAMHRRVLFCHAQIDPFSFFEFWFSWEIWFVWRVDLWGAWHKGSERLFFARYKYLMHRSQGKACVVLFSVETHHNMQCSCQMWAVSYRYRPVFYVACGLLELSKMCMHVHVLCAAAGGGSLWHAEESGRALRAFGASGLHLWLPVSSRYSQLDTVHVSTERHVSSMLAASYECMQTCLCWQYFLALTVSQQHCTACIASFSSLPYPCFEAHHGRSAFLVELQACCDDYDNTLHPRGICHDHLVDDAAWSAWN